MKRKGPEMGIHENENLLHSKGKSPDWRVRPQNGRTSLPIRQLRSTNNQNLKWDQKTKLSKNQWFNE
jgi:hypothetical protein